MNEFLTLTDPNEMHTAADRQLHEDPFALEMADLAVTGMSQATRYAPDNKNLLREPWVSEALAFVTNELDFDLPADGSAVVVMSNDFFAAGFESGNGTPVAAHRRQVYRLKADGTAQGGEFGMCHRCSLPVLVMRLMGDVPVHEPLVQFQISRGRFVIEFGVCGKCFTYLNQFYGDIVQVITREPV